MVRSTPIHYGKPHPVKWPVIHHPSTYMKNHTLSNRWARGCSCHPTTHLEHSPDNWLQEMECRNKYEEGRNPNYFLGNSQTLITTSQPLSFTLGTGAQVLSSVLSSCLETNNELILATCFWAKNSQAREDVATLLRKLSEKALARNRTIEVRICFSTESTWRLLNVSRRHGKIHRPKSWKRLGLPPREEIKGLNMVVKSAFVLPFSVMHPKFVLVDRQKAWMPSCNVSWENWFEGCIEMEGDITKKIYEFWNAFWGNGAAKLPPLPPNSPASRNDLLRLDLSTGSTEQPRASTISQTPVSLSGIPTILLPSPHHWNPSFGGLLLPSGLHITPFTTFLHHIFRAAKSSIYIQTPNLTARPVVRAILDAINRGVDVHIITSKRLMTYEQLLTSGRTTVGEVKHLKACYDNLLRNKRGLTRRCERSVRRGRAMDMPGRLGTLSIGYYIPKTEDDVNEPLKNHLKFICVDDEVSVLGSGNMDRASWRTSQELAVAFFSRDLAVQLAESIENALEGRVKYVQQLGL